MYRHRFGCFWCRRVLRLLSAKGSSGRNGCPRRYPHLPSWPSWVLSFTKPDTNEADLPENEHSDAQLTWESSLSSSSCIACRLRTCSNFALSKSQCWNKPASNSPYLLKGCLPPQGGTLRFVYVTTNFATREYKGVDMLGVHKVDGRQLAFT